jgi:hypothetical protein
MGDACPRDWTGTSATGSGTGTRNCPGCEATRHVASHPGPETVCFYSGVDQALIDSDDVAEADNALA